MNGLLIFLLALLVIGSDTYLFLPWLRPEMIFFLCCATWKNTIIGRTEIPLPHPAEQRARNSLKTVYALFMMMMIITDTCHGYILNTLPSYLCHWMIFGTFLILEQKESNCRDIYFFMSFSFIYNIFFAFFQRAGIFITAGSLSEIIPIIGVERLFVGDTGQGLRVSGSFQSCIPLSMLFGILVCTLVFAGKIFGHKRLNIFMLACCIWALLNTQTRSAILSLPIALFLTDLFLFLKNTERWKAALKRAALLAVLLVAAWFWGEEYISSQQSRVATFSDGSSVLRYQVNVAGVVGTLMLSPWVGVSRAPDKAMEAILVGYAKCGDLFDRRWAPIVTHHCEPAYYFRYYGIIGFTLYLLLYISIIRYIFVCKKDVAIQKALLAVILYFFFFSLMHNTKLIASLSVWILLALNAPPDKGEPLKSVK